MNALFGVCMGSIIYRLFENEEYFHAVLAVIAFGIYLFTISR